MTPDNARIAILANRRAWAAARMNAQPNMDVLANPDILDAMLIWRMSDPRFAQEGTKAMTQRQWTIEARADFADPDKNEVIQNAVREAAVHVHATMALLSDGQKPQVVCFADDFFNGHEEIALHEDKLGNAIRDHGANVGDGGVSDEMRAAARELQHDKNNAPK